MEAGGWGEAGGPAFKNKRVGVGRGHAECPEKPTEPPGICAFDIFAPPSRCSEMFKLIFISMGGQTRAKMTLGSLDHDTSHLRGGARPEPSCAQCAEAFSSADSRPPWSPRSLSEMEAAWLETAATQGLGPRLLHLSHLPDPPPWAPGVKPQVIPDVSSPLLTLGPLHRAQTPLSLSRHPSLENHHLTVTLGEGAAQPKKGVVLDGRCLDSF